MTDTTTLLLGPAARPSAQPAGEPALEAWQPALELDELHKHVATALAVLGKRQAPVATRWTYYDGPHPQLWATERFRKAFGGKFTDQLEDNYCGLYVDAIVDRLQVTSWEEVIAAAADTGEEAEAGDTEAAAALWADNELDLEQEELYRAAEVAGDAYVIVWPRKDADGEPEVGPRGAPLYDVVLNDARNVYVHSTASGRRRRWAAKVWRDEADRCWRCTLYYPGEVVRLRTRSLSIGGAAYPAKAAVFELDRDDPGGLSPFATDDNPEPGVPVFRFAANARGRSKLDRLRPGQDKINKLAANKMVTAEFLAWPQRWILSGQDIEDDKLRPSPASVLVVDPGGTDEEGEDQPRTQVGEWSAADLTKYDTAIQAEVDKLFTLAPLPRHMMQNPGADASGAAITADEGPFTSVVEDRQQLYGASWGDLMELLGYRVKPQWKPATTSQPEADARTLLVLTQAGVPLEVALVHVGWPEDRVRAAVEALAAERARQARAEEAAMRAAAAGMSAGEYVDEGLGGATTRVLTPEEVAEAADAMGKLIRSGVDPDDAAARVGLAGLRFTGAVPTSLRLPEADATGLEATGAGGS